MFSGVQNNLHELWSLLNFLLPEIFSSAETFDEWFQISGENDQQEVVQQLHKVIASPYHLIQSKGIVFHPITSFFCGFSLLRSSGHFSLED